AARVSGRGPGEDVRAQPGGRDFHGCRPCAPVVARARYKQAGITAAERELVPDDVQIAGAIDRQCDAADEGASSRRYCAVDAPEPAGHCPAESDPLASGDAHLIRSATLRRRGGVRNEDVVCGRADLWLAERAHRAGTGCHGERPERDTGLGALAPNWRARERQLVLRLSCRTPAVTADDRHGEVDAAAGERITVDRVPGAIGAVVRNRVARGAKRRALVVGPGGSVVRRCLSSEAVAEVDVISRIGRDLAVAASWQPARRKSAGARVSRRNPLEACA